MTDETGRPLRQLERSGAKQAAFLFAKLWAAGEITTLKSGWDSVRIRHSSSACYPASNIMHKEDTVTCAAVSFLSPELGE